MKYILTNYPIVEDMLVQEFKEYLSELRFREFLPNHANINISQDHPFEILLQNEGDKPDIFPSVTIVSSNDGEVPGMSKGWEEAELKPGDLDDIDPIKWYSTDTALTEMREAVDDKGALFGVMHKTLWRDSVSIEIWTENIQVKNDIYNLAMAFITGPKILGLHNDHDLVIHSNSINGQRSGYYNFNFGRVLYGGRISFSVDYPILQAVYDSSIRSILDIQTILVPEVVHG